MFERGTREPTTTAMDAIAMNYFGPTMHARTVVDVAVVIVVKKKVESWQLMAAGNGESVNLSINQQRMESWCVQRNVEENSFWLKVQVGSELAAAGLLRVTELLSHDRKRNVGNK